jgi:hypothetical protein
MLRRAPKVSLSAEQRDDLDRFSRSRTLPVRKAERVRIVLRAAAGQDNQEIAEAMGRIFSMTGGPSKAERKRVPARHVAEPKHF